MIKFGLKNITFLAFIAKIPILKHFFVLRVSENFHHVSQEGVLNKFYQDIFVSSKTSKKTHANRFNELDKYSLRFLDKTAKNHLHDVAVSSGISSFEFYTLLKEEKYKFDLSISDKYSKVHVKKGFITRVYDIDNQFIFGYLGFLFAVDKNIYFPLTGVFYQLLKRKKNKQKYDYDLLLFHPKVLNEINNSNILYINYDIFTGEIENKFSFVRCMNILNKGYFNDELLNKAVKNIKSSLKEGGILLVGRTLSDGKNHASYFKKTGGKLEFLEDFNDGSEIKAILNQN